jgi:hypothetical protein
VNVQCPSGGLDVHARSVVACGLDRETGELFERWPRTQHYGDSDSGGSGGSQQTQRWRIPATTVDTAATSPLPRGTTNATQVKSPGNSTGIHNRCRVADFGMCPREPKSVLDCLISCRR